MDIINLTVHDITIVKNEKTEIIPPSGAVARCETQEVLIGRVNEVDIYKINYGKVTGLPPANKNTVYITSALVAQAVKEMRNDVLIPNDFVRDEKGVIIGCRSLAQV